MCQAIKYIYLCCNHVLANSGQSRGVCACVSPSGVCVCALEDVHSQHLLHVALLAALDVLISLHAVTF